MSEIPGLTGSSEIDAVTLRLDGPGASGGFSPGTREGRGVAAREAGMLVPALSMLPVGFDPSYSRHGLFGVKGAASDNVWGANAECPGPIEMQDHAEGL